MADVLYSCTMKTGGTEASPAKALLEELESFRGLCHGTLDAIGTRMDDQLDAVRLRVEALGSAESLPQGKIRDLRDMLTLLRTNGIKPEKGRRKDLKKLDTITEDLAMLVQNWS